MAEFAPRIWQVGALCRAVADALDARFNPVAVRGEISGLSRASSGHCYFSIKDSGGQIRCVMFKRAFGLLDFAPREGDQVEIRGRIGLYEPRGDLQLVVESMERAGAGALFEQFLRLKAKLDAEGLFDEARKRELPLLPRGIGVVTSLGAAALHDVTSALTRRVPHIPVVVAVAAVQGHGSPAELCWALTSLYGLASSTSVSTRRSQDWSPRQNFDVVLDAILLVRGGGSIEDLWAFNDESLARVIARSPVPVISGVGHETDFTIADFVADLRAPTPTAAAEMVAQPRATWLAMVDLLHQRMCDAVSHRMDVDAQRIDTAAARMGRPSSRVAAQRATLGASERRLRTGISAQLTRLARDLEQSRRNVPPRLQRGLDRTRERIARAQLRLDLLDPRLVLQRGYAWLADESGRTVTGPEQVSPGQTVRATVARGTVDLVRPATT